MTAHEPLIVHERDGDEKIQVRLYDNADAIGLEVTVAFEVPGVAGSTVDITVDLLLPPDEVTKAQEYMAAVRQTRGF